MAKLLEIKDIHKEFGKRKILKGVNLDINVGEKIAILGSNGAGKSTLINIITGIEKETMGKIVYFGNEKYTSKDFNSKLGIQFQQQNYPEKFTVSEIINLIYDKNYDKKKWNKRKEWIEKERDPYIMKYLKLFDLYEKKNQNIAKLSGGEKQKLSIVIAIFLKPKILIFDEILTGLDIESQEKILSWIENYVHKNNCTLIIISHLLPEILRLSKKIVILDDGKVKEISTKDKIIEEYGSIEKYVQNYFLEEKIKKVD